MHATTLTTPAGPFTLVVHDGAVVAAGFTDDTGDLMTLVHPSLRPPVPDGTTPDGTAPGDRNHDDAAAAARAAAAVERYFAGDVTALDDVPVRQHSDGEFLRHAWAVLRTVGAGDPVTYRGFAELAGRPAAVRAAAQACARNAVALFVPCHRVVPSAGGGGYRWGLPVKDRLLAHERGIHETLSATAGETR
jgi:methylated-DNA-[protein]-cysteine S-methyltransferase